MLYQLSLPSICIIRKDPWQLVPIRVALSGIIVKGAVEAGTMVSKERLSFPQALHKVGVRGEVPSESYCIVLSVRYAILCIVVRVTTCGNDFRSPRYE